MNFTLLCLTQWLTWYWVWLICGVTSDRNRSRESFRERLPHMLLLWLGVALIFSPVVGIGGALGWGNAGRWIATGGVVAGLGFASYARIYLGKNWSGLVAIKRHHALVSSGPYRYVRHPIYSGLIAAAIASALMINSPASILGAAIFAAALVVKLKHEERLLATTFGKDYQKLRAIVNYRLIPGLC